ncbi:hypothetical protein [Pseudomonas azotoformans]
MTDIEEDEDFVVELDSDDDDWGNDEDPYTDEEKEQAGSSELFNSYD